MASGSQGKSGVFANGLPSSIAALARRTACHFGASSSHRHHQKAKKQQQQQQQQLRANSYPVEETKQQEHAMYRTCNGLASGPEQNHAQDEGRAFYADQLRRGQLNQCLQTTLSEQANKQQQQIRSHSQVQEQLQASLPPVGQRTGPTVRLAQQDDEEATESTRKKKYLTAKYGAQQMSLIKKRLKIEMWLHERLQELTSASKALERDQIDELDIDLDQLLDLEDEHARRLHLADLLAPLADLPRDQVDAFICDVLEQSKLL